MNLLISSDGVAEKVCSINNNSDCLPTTLAPDDHGIESPLPEQAICDLFSNHADDDSIAEVEDGLTQIRLRQIDKVATDTSDSLLSTSDTLSSYSGCSVSGVGEPFVAVFEGVLEVSQDEVWNEADNGNDDDSAVLVCSVDGSLSGSVASSHDQPDEFVPKVNISSSDSVVDLGVQKSDSNNLSWFGTEIALYIL